MMDMESIALSDGVPVADAIEQHRVIDPEDEITFDTSWIDALEDRYVNEADAVDQAIIVPFPDDDSAEEGVAWV